jgi:hypothetical protein
MESQSVVVARNEVHSISGNYLLYFPIWPSVLGYPPSYTDTERARERGYYH